MPRRIRVQRVPEVAILCLALLLVSSRAAHAYIDAGSGTYLFQMAIAGIVGVLYTVKLSWKRLVGGFRRLTGRNDGGE